MPFKVYIETSVVSYLTSFPSRDLLVAAHQKITHAWWTTRDRFELYVSEAVLSEARAGDPGAAQRRLVAISAFPVLVTTDDAVALARRFVSEGALPQKAFLDALHVAIAAMHGLDFLVTWNCTHTANAQIRARLEAICRSRNLQPPTICTPEELQE